MPEKEPTQSKLDEKTQQRLTEIDAELYVFKQKAKGDAKANLKLVEMERAKELILEKKELMGQYVKPWDVKKEITEEDWQAMASNLGELRKVKYWPMFIKIAARMKIIDSKNDLGLDNQDWLSITDELESQRSDIEWWQFTDYAAYIKIINSDYDLALTAKEWQGMYEELDGYRKSEDNMSLFCDQAVHMKILDPNKALGITDEDWQTVEKDMLGCRNLPNWVVFSEYASAMKILAPNRDIGITVDNWKAMRKELESHRSEESSGSHFTVLASNMKILAARSVKITEKGLEIID